MHNQKTSKLAKQRNDQIKQNETKKNLEKHHCVHFV